MNYLSISSLVLSVLTFGVMSHGLYLIGKIRMLRNFNNSGDQNLRIEATKRRARKTHILASLMCGATGLICGANAHYALALMFAGLGIVSLLSVFLHSADRLPVKQTAAEGRREEKVEERDRRLAAQFNKAAINDEETFLKTRQYRENPAIDENDPFADFYYRERNIKIEHTREKQRLSQEDDILDSDLLI